MKKLRILVCKSDIFIFLVINVIGLCVIIKSSKTVNESYSVNKISLSLKSQKESKETINTHKLKSFEHYTDIENKLNKIVDSNKSNLEQNSNFKLALKEKDKKSNKKEISIENIDLNIFINNNDTDGLITEIVKFSLTPGRYNHIIRRISLGGTYDFLNGFKLISSDVKLLDAKVVKNCANNIGKEFKSTNKNSNPKIFLNNLASTKNRDMKTIGNNINDYDTSENQALIDNYFESIDGSLSKVPYLCIIIHIDEIKIPEKDDNNKNYLIVGFEYSAKHILKKREKPFSNVDELENVMIWDYYNYNLNSNIKSIDISAKINSKISHFNKISLYPEVNSNKSLIENGLIVSWTSTNVKPGSHQNFILNLPLFNSQCKQMNEIRIELNTYNLIQIILVLSIFLMIIGYVVYLYINSSNNKLKDEIQETNSNIGDSFNQSFHFD